VTQDPLWYIWFFWMLYLLGKRLETSFASLLRWPLESQIFRGNWNVVVEVLSLLRDWMPSSL
jgi:hypothetical protein